MRKRLLSLLLCTVMVLSLLPGAGRAAEASFSDVRTGDWFYEAVQFVCEQGLMNGTGGEGADYDFSTPVTSSFTLYAQWAEKAEGGDTIYAYDPSHVAEEDGLQFIDNIVLAFTKPNLSAAQKDKIAASIGGAVAGSMTEVADILQIRVPRSSYAELMDMAAALERLDTVYSATCDLAGLDAMADDTATGLSGKDNTAIWQDTDPWGEGKERNDWWAEATHCYEAWREFSEYFTPIKVGVVDTGVLPSHEDLRVAFPSPYFHNISTPGDHGTEVAGLIAARNNNVGMCGVAYQAQLVCVDRRSGGTRWIDMLHKYNAILRSGARIINNSYGYGSYTEKGYMNLDDFKSLRDKGTTYEEFLKGRNRTIIQSANVIADYTCSVIQKGWDPLFVQAAGNGVDNGNFNGKGENAIHNGLWSTLTRTNTTDTVAKYGMTSDELLQHIIIVGNVQNKRQGDSYILDESSNYGETVSICAPGIQDYTTAVDGGYTSGDGTSLSAPIVSGAAALVWSINPSLTAGEVKNILVTNHSVNAVGLKPEHGTYPMLDVHAACAAAVETLESNKTSGMGKVFANYTHTAGVPLDGATVTLTRTNDGTSQTCTTDASGRYNFRLGEGRYHITFTCEGFTTSEADFVITRDLANKDYVEFQDVYLDPVDTAHSTRHTLRVCFVDAETGAQLSLTELFGEENDAGVREGYGIAYLALCDARNDDFYMGGFLRDSIVIEGNYLVFEDVEAGSQYYLSFDAVFNDGYRLPYSSDMEKTGRDSEWAYGFFEASGTQATTVIHVPLHSETHSGGGGGS